MDTTIINIYAPNRRAASYISQPLIRIKRHIDNNTLIVGDLNTPLSAIDRSPKQKINKETRALNDILDQMDNMDIYTTPQNNRILILLECTWNVLHYRPYTGSQKRSQSIARD